MEITLIYSCFSNDDHNTDFYNMVIKCQFNLVRDSQILGHMDKVYSIAMVHDKYVFQKEIKII